jgi:general secretion pathway protein K
MLTVMLVATFSAAALWQQWRAAEVEGAERARVQAAWVLIGALDWSRLILAEDGRAGGPDHLGEPWAVPLEEARLTSFLSADKNVSSDNLEGLPDAFLSGRIVDAQSKLNVLSLVDAGKPVPASVATFTRLFNLLGLPASELSQMTTGLVRALSTGTDEASGGGDAGNAPLMPQEVSQLVWLGLSPSTAAAIEPYVTILPVRTTLNLNTASAEAISASMENLPIASARQLVEKRTRSYFKTIDEANRRPAQRRLPLQCGPARRGHPVLRGLRAPAPGPHLGRGALAPAAQRCHGDDGLAHPRRRRNNHSGQTLSAVYIY